VTPAADAVGRIDDRFRGPGLDERRWIPAYLPHWTDPAAAAARWDLVPDGRRLRIDADQPAWMPEDMPMRVSAIQTGSVAGPVGTRLGQDPHRPGLTVRTAVPVQRHWTPSAGRIEVVAAASADPTCMLGIWTLGALDGGQEEAGELCIAELFGRDAGRASSIVRFGIKPHEDPRLVEDVRDAVLPIDTTRPHAYAVEWGGGRARMLVDGRVIGEFDQAPEYPQQLVIALFEFPESVRRPPSAYPKSAVVHSVTGRAIAPGADGVGRA